MTRDEVAQEVCGRFAEALSLLVRGAVDEMSQRGIDRAAASAATQAVLRYVADNGPRPLGDAAEGDGT